MLRFSLKTMLVLITLTGVAIHSMTHPCLLTAVATVIATGGCLLFLFVSGLRKRRYFLAAVAGLCACYLVVADGSRVLPWSEWQLPPERIFNQNPASQEYFADNPIRSDSLLIWSYLTCIEEYRKANGMSSSVDTPRIIPASGLDVGNGKTIQLPAITTTPVSTVVMVDSNGNKVRVVQRYSPKNKPFFIIGHCWVALAIVIPSLLILASEKEVQKLGREDRHDRKIGDSRAT